MKIDRLIGILSILLQKDKVTMGELAEKFEVSTRTVLRDIDALNMAGIPIVSERGKGGGFSVMKGYRIDRTLLSSTDMQAILAGLKSLDSVSGTRRYRQLMEKISADSPAAINANGNIIIDLSGWDSLAVSDKIELVNTAIDRNVKIAFRYFSPNGESERIIEPYRLVFQWSSWYVWGYCGERCDYRMFKLSRMTELTLTDEKRGEREVPGYVCDKLRHTEGEVEIKVKIDESAKWRIIDEYGADFLQYNENGEIVVTFTWSDIPAFYRYILSFDDKAEIIEPLEYRKEFAELLKKMQNIYKI